MAKGRSLTLPMFIATPMRTGLHLMEVGLVDESGRWFSAKGDPILVQCVVGLFLEVPSHWTNLNKPQSTYDYVEDHHLGVAFLKEELKGNDCPRLLEVGGCSSPMTHGFAGDIYVSDIDAQTLQVGQMRFGSKFPNMNFLASDAPGCRLIRVPLMGWSCLPRCIISPIRLVVSRSFGVFSSRMVL